jgi:hypothetical protein
MLINFPSLSSTEDSIVLFLSEQGEGWIAGCLEAEFVWLHFMASHRVGMSDDLAMAIGRRLGAWIERTDGVDTATCYFGMWDARVADESLGLEPPDEAFLV